MVTFRNRGSWPTYVPDQVVIEIVSFYSTLTTEAREQRLEVGVVAEYAKPERVH